VVYGNEVVMAESESMPYEPVMGGVLASLQRIKDRLGVELGAVKKFGQTCVNGVIVHIYVCPVSLFLKGGESVKWVTLNEAIYLPCCESLKFLLQNFPLLRCMDCHWRNMVDVQQLGELKASLHNGRYAMEKIILAYVIPRPIKLRSLVRWMGLLGYEITKEWMWKHRESVQFSLTLGGYVVRDVALIPSYFSFRYDEWKRAVKKRTGKMRDGRCRFDQAWANGMSNSQGQIYKDVYKRQVFPDRCDNELMALLDILPRHPIVELVKGVMGTISGKLVEEIGWACQHRGRCVVYCHGEQRSPERVEMDMMPAYHYDGFVRAQRLGAYDERRYRREMDPGGRSGWRVDDDGRIFFFHSWGGCEDSRPPKEEEKKCKLRRSKRLKVVMIRRIIEEDGVD